MIGNGLFITVWSLVNMIYEAQLKVYKSDSTKEGSVNNQRDISRNTKIIK